MAKMYTSHPVAKFRVGKFRFQNAVLKLESDEAVEEFEKILAGMPAVERNRVKVLDVDGAARISQQIQALQPRATQVTDSSVGKPVESVPQVGTDKLEDLNVNGEPPAELRTSVLGLLGTKK